MLTFQIIAGLVISLHIIPVCQNAPTTENQEISLADNYTALSDDIKWFFRGVNKIAGVVEQMLPNVTNTNNMAETRTFSENTRLNFLMGMRHLLVGIREISMTFEQSFNTDHVKQLHQLKDAKKLVNELSDALKLWFKQIRAFVGHLMHLYNRYMPEMLFGKCLGSYLTLTYPQSSYYEYPFIIIWEIYTNLIASVESPSQEAITDLPLLETVVNMEQNEISVDDYNASSYKLKMPRQLSDSSEETLQTESTASFFDFSSVLPENKNEISENAIKQQSLQMCFKYYTVESISRSLKIYFLDG